MHINTWQREIERAFVSGDTEAYRKLVGVNRRVDRRSVEIALVRSSLAKRTWKQWLNAEVL